MSWKIQPEMPKNDSVPISPGCGLGGPLVGEVNGESIDFSFSALVFSLPGLSLSTVRLSALLQLHRECSAWKIKSN